MFRECHASNINYRCAAICFKTTRCPSWHTYLNCLLNYHKKLFISICQSLIWKASEHLLKNTLRIEEWVGITLTDLTPPYVCACSKSGPGFLMSYVMFLFVFNDLRWDVFVLFGDVAGIVDHHCLNFFLVHTYMNLHILVS